MIIGLIVFVLPFLLISLLMAIVVASKARKPKRTPIKLVVADMESDGSARVTEEFDYDPMRELVTRRCMETGNIVIANRNDDGSITIEESKHD